MRNKDVFFAVYSSLSNKEITFLNAVDIFLKLGFSVSAIKKNYEVTISKNDFSYIIFQNNVCIGMFDDFFDYYEKYLETKKGDISF